MSAACRVGMCREVPAGGMLAYRCIGVGVHFKRKEESRKGAAPFFSGTLHDRRYNNGGSLRTNLGVRPPKEPKKLWPKPVQIKCGMN